MSIPSSHASATLYVAYLMEDLARNRVGDRAMKLMSKLCMAHILTAVQDVHSSQQPAAECHDPFTHA
jgi:hypothetical protein